ncbi:MAG: hypothetical protein KUG77_01025 [Nannocystaceae bacterium]|nr:hypothetical protein [Nannocystaceae bacterium]
MTNYLAWLHKIVPKACSLYHFEGFEKSHLLTEGIRVSALYPDGVYFDMHPDRPRDVLLVDSLFNTDNELVLSERLVAFLLGKSLPNLEFLPVKIMDHKGNFIDEKYSIMNVLEHQDCLDVDASEPEVSTINDKTIESVEQLVLVEGKVDDSFQIFRIANFAATTLVEESLARAIEAEFTGVEFVPLEDFE